MLRPGDGPIIEELFQLFKTPWEVCREGGYYDVVIASDDRVPRTRPRLLVVYGDGTGAIDSLAGAAQRRYPEAAIEYFGKTIPIYGGGTAFEISDSCIPLARCGSEVSAYFTESVDGRIVRLGYDLVREVEILLTRGQPAQWSQVPTLDWHIEILRNEILRAGIPLLEIPPTPFGHNFSACLTHDIDFVGIRPHKFDHTMWGFLYRSIVGGLRDCVVGRISVRRLLRMWWAVVKLPMVYLGLARDYWLPFEWYLREEIGLPATYFIVPFKNRAGEGVVATHPDRRATKYDVTDIPHWLTLLTSNGHEIGVHGIDAWHSSTHGMAELNRVASAVNTSVCGIRMHWLLQDERTHAALEDAGYEYDSTAGYNDVVGFRCGTTQVFRPLGVEHLLELPLHIQDGALFFATKMHVDEGASVAHLRFDDSRAGKHRRRTDGALARSQPRSGAVLGRLLCQIAPQTARSESMVCNRRRHHTLGPKATQGSLLGVRTRRLERADTRLLRRRGDRSPVETARFYGAGSGARFTHSRNRCAPLRGTGASMSISESRPTRLPKFHRTH